MAHFPSFPKCRQGPEEVLEDDQGFPRLGNIMDGEWMTVFSIAACIFDLPVDLICIYDLI